MKNSELLQIFIAIITLSIVTGFNSISHLDYNSLGLAIIFSTIIILANVFGKEIMANKLDAGVEHSIWQWKRYGIHPISHLKKSISAGVIFPIFISVISLGSVKLMTILSYETRALKRRASRRFGPFSFTEMTDSHTALIGASGIVAVLLVSFLGYWIEGFENLSRLAAFYAFYNLIPFSKLDGTQIYFGSRVLWSTLAIITLIFTSYALLLI